MSLTLENKTLLTLFWLVLLNPCVSCLYAQSKDSLNLPTLGQTITSLDGRPSQILNNESPNAIVVGLPTAKSLNNGRLNVEPYAAIMPTETHLRRGADGSTRRDTLFNSGSQQMRLFSPIEYSIQNQPVTNQPLPSPLGSTGSSHETGLEPSIAHEPLLGKIISRRVRENRPIRSIIQKVLGCDSGPGGIGRERIGNAMFRIDSATPQNMKGLQIGLDYGREFVDRAGIYWRPASGGGPSLVEQSVRAQEARLMLENGSEKFSLTTIVPFRAVDPVINDNHAGLSDMSVTTKVVLLDGAKLQLTQMFRSFFNTGAASSGLGTGHISFEPGLLARYKFRPQTEIHYSLTYLFPVGSDPIASGQALRWGIGGVHTTMDTDNFAWLSTIELTGWNVLNGTETLPTGSVISSDGVDIVNLTTGSRWVFDNGGDLGLFEFGYSSSLPISSDQWYDASFMLDFRWIQ